MSLTEGLSAFYSELLISIYFNSIDTIMTSLWRTVILLATFLQTLFSKWNIDGLDMFWDMMDFLHEIIEGSLCSSRMAL